MSSIDLPPAGRPVTPSAPAKSVLSDLPVTAAPAGLPDASGKTTVDAKVSSYDSKAQVLKLLTPQGEVSVKSPLPLKPGTELQLELSRSADGRITANLTPQRAPAATTPPAPETPQANRPVSQPPQPPLKPGDTSTAIFIRDNPQQNTAPSSGPAPSPVTQAAKGVPLTPAEITAIIEQIKTKGTILPAMPKETADIMADFMAKSPSLETFKALPQTSQQQLMAVFSQMEPPTDNALSALLFGSQPGALSPPQADNAAQPSVVAQNPNQTAKSVADPVSSLLQSLLPLLQNNEGASLPTLTPRQGVDQLASQLPQNMFRITIANIIPQGQAAPALQPGQIIGTVEKLTTQGAPVIRTDEGFFVLDAKRPLPVGTQIVFNAQSLTAEQLLATIPPAVKLITSGSFNWPALQESIDSLMVSMPDVAQLIRNSIPAPTEKFTATALFFMAALKSGSIDNWLGQNTLNILRQAGKKGLLERLTDDFLSLSKQSQSASGEWRGVSMPFMHDDRLSMLQFFVKHHPLPQQDEGQGSDQEGPKQMTRFILNFNLSRMGDIQLDGLVQKEKMDMILRTAEDLPFAMRQEIMQAYAKGIEQTNMQGSIGFQTRRQKWIDVPQPPVSGTLSA